MKNKASSLVKKIMAAVTALIKARHVAVKRKAMTMKDRLLIFGLLRSKKMFLPGVSSKIHALIAHVKGEHHGAEDLNKAIVPYDPMACVAPTDQVYTGLALVDGEEDDYEEDDDDKYPDLTHCLFDELEFDNGTESVIDLVKNSREDASNFNLEDEIDHVADVFIKRFHRRLQMQKQDSFKWYMEMLNRSV